MVKHLMKHLTMMSLGLLLAFGALATGSAHAACLIGSYPRVDNWGIPVCKSFDTGQNTTRQGSLSQCPGGSHPWVDERGSRICQFFNQEVHYYDTSKGCPQARIAGLMIGAIRPARPSERIVGW
jgi:hypothetical protein